ncbi:MAG: fasciclin domain-containing protein, partial [Trueperaceae bacterium]|nr:fasciclin domain-containing protein [Trueperaceae bacterium]
MRSIVLSLLAAVALTGAATAQTIPEVAASAGSFDTLVTAVQEAGLVDTLASDGPFTVFAPTDDAFAALPDGLLETVLADPDLLTAVLTYHVVAGEVPASDVVNLASAETVQGESVTIQVEGGTVHVNDATVVQADVAADNGLIHVVDTVLLPPSVVAASTDAIRLPVGSLGDSGVSGDITLERAQGGTLVTLDLDGTPEGGNHPAHFHTGDCSAPGPVAIPLNNVDGTTGMSVTQVDAPIEA